MPCHGNEGGHFGPKLPVSALIVQQTLHISVFWLAHAARLLTTGHGLPASPCRQTCSTQPQWTNLSHHPWVCLARRSSVVPYQAKEEQFGQQGCKAKAENPTPHPHPHPRASLNKLLFTVKCIKKANTFLVKVNTRSITEVPMSQHKEKLFFSGLLPLNYWLAM